MNTAVAGQPNTLSITEQTILAENERIIERGLKTFYEVGNALIQIRDSRLYREQYSTFEEYCQGRWQLERRRAYQLMDTSLVFNNVKNFSHLPANEAQTQPLVSLEPDEQRLAWAAVIEAVGNDKITAKDVTLQVKRMKHVKEALNKSPDEYRDRISELSGDEPEKIIILNRLYKSQGSPDTNGTFEEIILTGGFAYGDEMDKRCIYTDASITDINKALASVARNHGIVTVQARAKDAQSLPEGTFNVIYADPPWQYDNAIPGTGAASDHYPTMPLEKICSFLDDNPFAIDTNAVLFMWVTNPFLQDAFKVLCAWGFAYKTNMCWMKTELEKPGGGYYVRGRHELLFIATRGSFTPLDKHIAPPIGSVISAPLQKHSQKPDDFYTVIERLYPQCNYLELFARREREGWRSYGNELG
jgi:N6-adenosine-specific RNA methylase IME4